MVTRELCCLTEKKKFKKGLIYKCCSVCKVEEKKQKKIKRAQMSEVSGRKQQTSLCIL